MSTNNRVKDPSAVGGQQLFLLIAVLFVILAGVAVWGALTLGHKLEDGAAPLPADPFDRIFGLFTGKVEWPAASTWILAGFGLAAVALGVGGAILSRPKGGRKRTRVDDAARHMGAGRDVESLTEKSAAATAQRLGVTGSTGVPIGTHLLSGRRLFGSFEDMHIDIWGPRTGKTTSRAIPAILEAPGSVLVTSNKRDVVDGTRDVRQASHGTVWVFDPQAIALEEPTWYWDPLSYVTDEVKAAKLAEHFASGSRAPDAKTDSFFDPAGQDLLAGLLLAAALDRRPITDVYRWLTRPDEDLPVQLLEEHGFTMVADQVAGVIHSPEKQRGGVYGTAQQMASCLTNRSIVRWIVRDGDDDVRPMFDPHAFIREGGTLYSLSKEGRGTAGPLVTGLTVAVVEAAEELAAKSPGGRLTVPLVGVLDEAANVCRWRSLPDLYSHYGSRGIVLMTILQSWSQGVEVWGESGMKKLWSASNVAVYGGGVKETAFLRDLVELIGQHDRLRTSVSVSENSRSSSRQVQKENTLTVDDLAALPKGRAIVLASGARATMIRTDPWMRRPYADAVKASIAAHDPGGQGTIAQAEAEASRVEAELETEGV